MAANYSQYTDHNELGGLRVGLEDAKLAAADTVDEVASTDCVLMKDASGNPVKILKEDFNEAVRDALGSILSLNPLGTAIGKVAALGSSDNDLGSISTSDLASVLGVKRLVVNGETGTGIAVNQGNGGLTILVIASMNYGSGDLTGSVIKMIRCVHSGNNITVTDIASNGQGVTQYPLTFSSSEYGQIMAVCADNAYWYLTLILSR